MYKIKIFMKKIYYPSAHLVFLKINNNRKTMGALERVQDKNNKNGGIFIFKILLFSK